MKKFYFKITGTVEAFGYSIIFSKEPLPSGEKGKGLYMLFEAKDKVEMMEAVKEHNFNGLRGIVLDPTAE